MTNEEKKELRGPFELQGPINCLAYAYKNIQKAGTINKEGTQTSAYEDPSPGFKTSLSLSYDLPMKHESLIKEVQ